MEKGKKGKENESKKEINEKEYIVNEREVEEKGRWT